MTDQPEPKEEKKTYLQEAKECFGSMNYLNSTYAQSGSVAALIFIGEQLEGINKILSEFLEHEKGSDSAVSLDESVKVWGSGK